MGIARQTGSGQHQRTGALPGAGRPELMAQKAVQPEGINDMAMVDKGKIIQPQIDTDKHGFWEKRQAESLKELQKPRTDFLGCGVNLYA